MQTAVRGPPGAAQGSPAGTRRSSVTSPNGAAMSSGSRTQPVPEPCATSSQAPVSGYPIRRIPAPEALLQPDGSVVIPPAVAGHVLRALVRDLTARVAADGGRLAPGVQRVLFALHAAAQQPVPVQGCDTASVPVSGGTIGLTVDQAAAVLECSPQWVRHLLAAGRLDGHRAGARLWLVDPDSLDAYRKGAPCPSSSPTPSSAAPA